MRFHPWRERLLAEVHARPSTPIQPPMLVTRLATLSGVGGADADFAHMAALCRRFGKPEPGAGMRWWKLDLGEWQLRWERHSEFSSWTFLAPPEAEGTATHRVPPDWLAAIPGEVLVSTTLRLRRGHHNHAAPAERQDVIGSRLLDGAATLLTDLKADQQGMTQMDVLVHSDDPVLAGRLALILLEIETYRLLALLAFPVAGDAAVQVAEIEAEAGALAARIDEDMGVEGDRALLNRLVSLSGRMEALSSSTNFRFGAGNAYYEIVQGRIASLRETPIPGLQTIGEFMERRLSPAMRTCANVAARERAVIDRIARAGQMLNIRVDLVTQAINADLLSSMDRRALAQFNLQRTIEGLSVAAISYYVVSLLAYVFKGIEERVQGFEAPVAIALSAPLVLIIVWFGMHRIRRSLEDE